MYTKKIYRILLGINPLVHVKNDEEIGIPPGIIRFNLLIDRVGWIKARECKEVERLIEATQFSIK